MKLAKLSIFLINITTALNATLRENSFYAAPLPIKIVTIAKTQIARLVFLRYTTALNAKQTSLSLSLYEIVIAKTLVLNALIPVTSLDRHTAIFPATMTVGLTAWNAPQQQHARPAPNPTTTQKTVNVTHVLATVTHAPVQWVAPNARAQTFSFSMTWHASPVKEMVY